MLQVSDSKKQNEVKIIGIFENQAIDENILLQVGDFSDLVKKEYGEVTKIPTYHKVEYSSLCYVGLGKEEDLTLEKIKCIFGKAFKRIENAVVFVDELVCKNIEVESLIYNISLAFYLAKYQYPKSLEDENNFNGHLRIVSNNAFKEEVINRASVIGVAVNNARTLGNTPSNYLTPEDLATYALKIAKEANLECNILTQTDLINMKAGGILAVNLGSDKEAKMIVLKHEGKKGTPFTALIGKGITFDSGGYNLKPAASMTGMKYDMCGGANVISAMEIIGKLNLEANVYGIIPATENLINGHGYKCDDVITMLSGKTVEVTNTDAEGRLILADALTYAQQLGATNLIDIATLTGACANALGKEFTGAFTNNQSFFEKYQRACMKEGEPIWLLPITDGFRAHLKKTRVAEIVNSIRVGGGASIAACFLEEFVESDSNWIHLDIAGTSDVDAEFDLGPAGATGVMVQSMAKFILDLNK